MTRSVTATSCSLNRRIKLYYIKLLLPKIRFELNQTSTCPPTFTKTMISHGFFLFSCLLCISLIWTIVKSLLGFFLTLSSNSYKKCLSVMCAFQGCKWSSQSKQTKTLHNNQTVHRTSPFGKMWGNGRSEGYFPTFYTYSVSLGSNDFKSCLLILSIISIFRVHHLQQLLFISFTVLPAPWNGLWFWMLWHHHTPIKWVITLSSWFLSCSLSPLVSYFGVRENAVTPE